MKVRHFFKKSLENRICKLIDQVYTLGLYLTGSRDMTEHLTKETFYLCKEADLYSKDLTLWKNFVIFSLINLV